MSKLNFHFESVSETCKEPINILIEGGIGDAAMEIPWLIAFKNALEKDQVINLYARLPALFKHILPWAEDIKTYTQFEIDRPKMGYYLVLTDMVTFNVQQPKIVLSPQLALMLQNYNKSYEVFGYLFPKFPLTAQMLSRTAVAAGLNRRTLCFAQVGLQYIEFEYSCERPKDMPEKCLVVNDGFANWHRVKSVTKCWDETHWDNFLREFKVKHPDISIVQIGSEGNGPILRSDINLKGKTSLTEFIAWSIHADYYVGNDSGPTHIRHWGKKPATILFGPSPADYYGYEENINLVGSKCCPCYWMQPDWNEHCKIGEKSCLRMQSITPEAVMLAIGEQINGANRA